MPKKETNVESRYIKSVDSGGGGKIHYHRRQFVKEG